MTPINHYEGERPKEKVTHILCPAPEIIEQVNYRKWNEVLFYSWGSTSMPITISPYTVAIFRIKYKQ